MALPVAQPADLKSRIAKLRSTLLFLNDKMRESVSDEKKDDHCRLRDAVARSFTPESSLPGHAELREWLTANDYESRYGGNGLRRAIGTLEKELAASEKELRKRQRDEQQPDQPPQQQQETKTGEGDLDEFAAQPEVGEPEASTKRLRPALNPFATAAARPTSNKLVICDMNQLLLYKYQKGENGPGVRGHKSKAIIRPFANEFLRTLSEKVHLALWTSGGRRNVANWEQILFRGVPLVFRWYNDRCTFWKESGMEAELCKPMERVWDDFPQFRPGNTVMIDDSPHKMRNNPPYSYFCPPPYRITFDNSTEPPTPIVPDDRALEPYKGELWLYLAALADYDGDCREFMLDYPYPTRPASEPAS